MTSLSSSAAIAADPVFQAIATRAAKGEVLTGAQEIAPALGLHPATVRRRILSLAARGAIVIRPGRSNAVRRIIEVPGIGSTMPADTPVTRLLDWLADHPGASVHEIAAGLRITVPDAKERVRHARTHDRIARAPGDGRARYMLPGASPPPHPGHAPDLPTADDWPAVWDCVYTLARRHRDRTGGLDMQVTMQTDRGIRMTTTTDRAGAPVYCVELEVAGAWEVLSDHETPAAALMAATALVMDETATAA